MKEFNPDLLIPLQGELKARIFQNESLGIPPTLFWDIEIPLKPFSLEGKTVNTTIILNFIRIPVSSITELSGKDFVFPVNPEEGYIDGSVYIRNAHHPVDITKLFFGEIENGKIPVSFSYDVLFEYERSGYANLFSVELSTELSLTELQIDYEILEDLEYNVEKVTEVVANHFNLTELGSVIQEEEDIYFRFNTKV